MEFADTDASVLEEEIEELKSTRNAVILAHVYQRPAVQRIADFTGDSLGLSRRAVETDAQVIVFCGVRFMAETASILNPDKVVLLPEPSAGCAMAEFATADAVRERVRKLGDNVAVVSYVNSTAEVKAESTICCTSANAVQVVQSLQEDRVLFVPDRNLASYVGEQTNKDVIAWDGHCYVHDPNISTGAIRELQRLHPNAVVMAHPECNAGVRRLAHFVGSTSQMLDFVAASDSQSFIVGTEEGLLHPLREQNPRKHFYSTGSVCSSMRLTTLASVRRALDRMSNVITVPEEVRERAVVALNRMLEV
ncbi:MAG: quinolinate synthase NadA [Candidatus Brocadiia bacterium]